MRDAKQGAERAKEMGAIGWWVDYFKYIFSLFYVMKFSLSSS